MILFKINYIMNIMTFKIADLFCLNVAIKSDENQKISSYVTANFSNILSVNINQNESVNIDLSTLLYLFFFDIEIVEYINSIIGNKLFIPPNCPIDLVLFI